MRLNVTSGSSRSALGMLSTPVNGAIAVGRKATVIASLAPASRVKEVGETVNSGVSIVNGPTCSGRVPEFSTWNVCSPVPVTGMAP